MENILYACDTNVFLDDVGKLGDYTVVVLSHVLRELDKHKSSSDSYLSFKARRATRFIDDNPNMVFDIDDYAGDGHNAAADPNYVDNKIIDACIEKGYGLITNDVLLKIKAKTYGVPILKLAEEEEGYAGVKEVECNDEELAKLTEMPEYNFYGLNLNEYLFVKNSKGEITGKFRWTEKGLSRLVYKNVKSKFMGDIKPRNVRQEMLFDLLQDKSITVKSAVGKFGTGKDFCMISHAISMIESQRFKKIVWVRNNIELEDTEELGFRKGDLFDKLIEFAMPLADHLGGVEGLRMFVEKGHIELQHLGTIRGRDIKNSIIYVTELQNNTSNHVKLLLGRVGEGSELWLNGDLKQLDRADFAGKNGLAALARLKSNGMFGQVTLDKTERSKTAALAELI